MRTQKALGLILACAVTAMALLGASTASAETTALCKKHENPCAAANIYTGHIEAVAVNPKLLTSLTTIQCKKALFLGNALGLANPLIIHVEKFEFFDDCLTAGEDPCEFKSLELGLALLLRTGSNLGTLTLHNTKILVSCPMEFIDCVYGGLPIFHMEGSPTQETLATILTNEVLWEHGESVFCPMEAKLDATYKVTLPDPIVISS
ncbi:MAG: hypothetical protein QOF85_279 [Solirubrobacterales bacterium]|nr:hypothetical protein [Solirubrobacterales bacterium]